MENNRYHQTKIYKIIDKNNEYYYIGSTTSSLSKRLSEHKNKSTTDINRPLYKHFLKIGWDDAKILLLEEHKLENRNQQLKEEDRVIQMYKNDEKCLNCLRCYTGLTIAEYRKDYYDRSINVRLQKGKEYYVQNSDKIKEYQKKYNSENKTKVSERQKQYYCKNKENLIIKSKLFYEDNKETLSQKQNCICGAQYFFMENVDMKAHKSIQILLIKLFPKK